MKKNRYVSVMLIILAHSAYIIILKWFILCHFQKFNTIDNLK